ncbi:MAG TPA: hypothetical protein VEH04_03905 [Verrucomicrobiae bacterium]|nr:hypothetical protein [Verrucomicrobiae bacterium]
MKKLPLVRWLVCLAAVLVPGLTSTSGQVVLSPASVVGNTLGESAPEASVTNMINQSGITTPFVSGSTHFDTYFATPSTVFANATASNNWQSEVVFTLPLAGTLDFDLGATYNVDKIAIWNISARDVTVRVADSIANLATALIAATNTLVNHINFPFSYPVDVLTLSNSYSGRYVRLDIHSAYTFSPSDTFAFAIIGEVVVSASTDVAVRGLSIHLESNGDAVVTFSGTLQSTTNATSSFIDVIGSPASPYIIPKATQSPEAYFRTRGN